MRRYLCAARCLFDGAATGSEATEQAEQSAEVDVVADEALRELQVHNFLVAAGWFSHWLAQVSAASAGAAILAVSKTMTATLKAEVAHAHQPN